MNATAQKILKSAQLIVITAFLGSACNLQGTASNCITGQTARIIILDGAVTRDCGCSEGGGSFGPSTPFQCTLKVGTKLFINYNTSAYHYLNFGTSSGVSPQSYTPGTDADVGAVGFSGTSPAGGFNFSDSGNSVTGVFIITN